MSAHLQPLDLLITWRRRFANLKRCHYRSCSYFEIRNRIFGAVTIFLAAAAPPLTYVATKLKVDDDPRILISATMVAALGGMLATLQIFFRDSERAERHRVAGATYAKLEADVELILAFPPTDALQFEKRIDEFRDEWARLTGASPVIPERIFQKVEHEIEPPPPVHADVSTTLPAQKGASADLATATRPPSG
ncbi:SLATT domain-containing protein [Methylomonas koyamae]|uniref:SLATT domain-containing protein n=1 Tax=Methylomonas koyamae TaxID=702114 RepID=UPI0028737478|nr:SLATT domain-containing protein [Methylomonas koyamae]WNB76903.1 SLATT domain-containing protein [Methylomonas koyamae]